MLRSIPKVAAAVFASFALLTGPLPAHATQADLDAELEGVLKDFQAKAQPINNIARRIKWTGMSDPRLFDAMEAVLQAHYQVDTNSDGVQYSSWLAQALAFSGQPKYRATLEKVLATTESDKLRHHTQRALQVLPKFASWNPVIAAGVEAAPTADIPKQRASNMLKAEDPELMHAGVILVLDHFLSDAAVTDLMRDRLVARYKQADNNPALAKTLASACKVLGQTGNSSYVPTLDAVAAYTKRSTLKRWAGWAGRRLKKLNG